MEVTPKHTTAPARSRPQRTRVRRRRNHNQIALQHALKAQRTRTAIHNDRLKNESEDEQRRIQTVKGRQVELERQSVDDDGVDGNNKGKMLKLESRKVHEICAKVKVLHIDINGDNHVQKDIAGGHATENESHTHRDTHRPRRRRQWQDCRRAHGGPEPKRHGPVPHRALAVRPQRDACQPQWCQRGQDGQS